MQLTPPAFGTVIASNAPSPGAAGTAISDKNQTKHNLSKSHIHSMSSFAGIYIYTYLLKNLNSETVSIRSVERSPIDSCPQQNN